MADSQTTVGRRSIDEDFAAHFPTSSAYYDRAVKVIPSGINHDVRRMEPFPVYMERATGSKKWDVDGNELIDYGIGHGSLILGHSHPKVLKALSNQVQTMTHASAPTPLEVEWAEQVVKMVPVADMARFVNSGTEATMLAKRVARGYTHRPVIARIQGHFHGWHDYAMVGWRPPYEVHTSAGIPDALDSSIRSVPINDLDALEAALAPGDVI